MAKLEEVKNANLLKDKRVVEEINRHLWIESEKAGKDIGFENAAVDWLEKFSKTWMNYHHTPQKKEVDIVESHTKSYSTSTQAKSTFSKLKGNGRKTKS